VFAWPPTLEEEVRYLVLVAVGQLGMVERSWRLAGERLVWVGPLASAVEVGSPG